MTKLKTAFIILLSSLCLFILIEGLLWIFLGRPGPKEVRFPFHPYLGYVAAENAEIDTSRQWRGMAETSIQTDENGYSITPHVTSAENPLRIVITGGSTMFGVGATNNETTVPSLIEKYINEDLGIEAEVTNIGISGYQAFQEMLTLNRYLAENEADIVLSITGFNDAFWSYIYPETTYRFLPKRNWLAVVKHIRAAELGYFLMLNLEQKFHTTLFLSEKWKEIKRKIFRKRKIQPLKVRDFSEVEGNIPNHIHIVSTHYKAMKTISESYGARYFVLFQPTALLKDQLSKEATEYILKQAGTQEIQDKVQRYLEAYYAAMRERRPLDDDFIDLSRALDGRSETMDYVDVCHYTDDGAKKLARVIVGRLQNSGILKKL